MQMMMRNGGVPPPMGIPGFEVVCNSLATLNVLSVLSTLSILPLKLFGFSVSAACSRARSLKHLCHSNGLAKGSIVEIA